MSMRGFVFSLDAFVAFTLALIAVYSLIFFSSIPSSYYYLLAQGHYLARDALWSVSTADCTDDFIFCSVDGSIMDNIISENNSDVRNELIRSSIGKIIPAQFGYVIEVSEDKGETWQTLYDTSEYTDDEHAKAPIKKLSVSSQIINFGYRGRVNKPMESIYKYNTCGTPTDGLVISCGEYNRIDPNYAGDIIPLPEAKIVRLTVFI